MISISGTINKEHLLATTLKAKGGIWNTGWWPNYIEGTLNCYYGPKKEIILGILDFGDQCLELIRQESPGFKLLLTEVVNMGLLNARVKIKYRTGPLNRDGSFNFYKCIFAIDENVPES